MTIRPAMSVTMFVTAIALSAPSYAQEEPCYVYLDHTCVPIVVNQSLPLDADPDTAPPPPVRRQVDWAQRNFANLQSTETAPPSRGDEIEATTGVNLREGPNRFDPRKGIFVPERKIREIAPGERFFVGRTMYREGAGSGDWFVWIQVDEGWLWYGELALLR